MTPCPNCDSQETEPDIRGYHKCLDCGVWFLPDIVEDDLYAYYRSGAYRERHHQQNEWEHQERRAAHIVQYIENPSVFVDIGCSMGALLDAVRRKCDCECYGVDIDTVLAHSVYKHIRFIPCPADTVTMIHSLEHMLHPLDELKAVHKQMTSGGRIIVEVPNSTSYKTAFSFPHVVMLNQESLHWTMEAAGFTVDQVVIHGQGGVKRAEQDYYLLMVGCKPKE